MGHPFLSTLHYACILTIFWRIVSCSPIQQPPLLANNACARIDLLPLSLSLPPHPPNLTIDHTTWSITPTLSLAITICNWQPSPTTILAVLSAANTAAGKKPADLLLEKTFVQRSDNKYNTLYFEIGPGIGGDKKLRWADVGDVLGEDGLVKFFRETRMWHTVYFDVVDSARGVVGEGAVRRWWQ